MKVLVADDDPISRLLMTRFLTGWGYEVESASDGIDAWSKLEQPDAPMLAILDWMMPGMDGVEICRRVRETADGRYRYLLLLTSRNGREDVLQGLDAGADDYITKPVDAPALKARLNAGRRVLDLQERLMQAVEANRYEATHDPLTGIWNRAAILEFLNAQFSRIRRDGVSLAIALADIDHFKRTNDTYGHLAGDGVLREVAKRIRRALRPYDWVGRYGGEEFLIIAPDCTMSNGFAMCERLRAAVAEEPIETDGKLVRVTTSFGLATTAETGAASEEELLRAADSALYMAKDNGRNRVEMAKRMLKARTGPFRPTSAVRNKELVQ